MMVPFHGGCDHGQRYALCVIFAKNLCVIWKGAPHCERVMPRMTSARSAVALLVSENLEEPLCLADQRSTLIFAF